MALRRPPTRVELKTDDIEEYHQLMREKDMEMQMQDPNAASSGLMRGVSHPFPTVAMNAEERKQNVAARIGIGRSRPG